MYYFTKIILGTALIVCSFVNIQAQTFQDDAPIFSRHDALPVDPLEKTNLLGIPHFSYNLSWPSELFYITPGVVLLATGELLPPKVLSQSMRDNLSINDIPAFEQKLIYFDTTQAAKANVLSDGIVVTTYAINLALVLAMLNDKNAAFTTGVIYAEGAFLTLGITAILKQSIGRVRPYAYNTDNPDSYRFRDGVTSSFPSAHTAGAAYNCFFAAKVLNDNYIAKASTGLRVITWAAAATIPALTGYLRTAAGEHFYTDILAGYALGAGMGYLLPALHLQSFEHAHLYPIMEKDYNGMGIFITW